MWTRVKSGGSNMLSKEDINNYRELQKEVNDANVERQTLKAEIQVYVSQGKEKLAKYGFSSFQDIPKLKKMLEELEGKVLQEKEDMLKYCTYMADKKQEKAQIFSREV